MILLINNQIQDIQEFDYTKIVVQEKLSGKDHFKIIKDNNDDYCILNTLSYTIITPSYQTIGKLILWLSSKYSFFIDGNEID
jgi:hypothetical protein